MPLHLPAILSPPPSCIPALALTVLAARVAAEVASPLHGSASDSGLRLSLAGSPMLQAVSCLTWFCLSTGSSPPVALHPVSRRRRYLRLRTASAPSDGAFHPTVVVHPQLRYRPPSRTTLPPPP